jgi:CheY-like chemotaxis protein
MASRKTVLVVDDDRDILDSMEEALVEEGYDVIAAVGGAQALEALKTGARPDVILLDLMMPGFSGFDFIERQRSDPALKAIPVLVLSADANAKAKAEAVGAAGHVQKPFKLQTLLDAIDRHAGP